MASIEQSRNNYPFHPTSRSKLAKKKLIIIIALLLDDDEEEEKKSKTISTEKKKKKNGYIIFGKIRKPKTNLRYVTHL